MSDTTEKPEAAEKDYSAYSQYDLTEDDKRAIDERDEMIESGKNPYALRRNLATAATVASLVIYLVLPADQVTVRAVVLIVFFILIMVLTYFQQQVRAFKTARRNPEAYDEKGRYHKEWENGRPEEQHEHKNAPNRNQKNRGKKKKSFNR